MTVKNFQELKEEQQQEIDKLILAGKAIEGIKAVISLLGMSLRGTFIFYSARYNELKIIAPEKFSEKDDQEYWGRFYAYWDKPIKAFGDLDEADRTEIDDFIFQERTLYGIKAIREKTNMLLKDASSFYHERLEKLKITHPEKFTG